MMTECNRRQLEFSNLGRRWVTAKFDGGHLTSGGGGVLLREVDARLGLMGRLAGCFTDHRNPAAIEHPVRDLVAQRIYALALGYEDLNDHNHLRADPLLALLVGKGDLTGQDRRRLRDKGKPLASPSALNRLERSRPEQARGDRYRKIAADTARMDGLLWDLFLDLFLDSLRFVKSNLDGDGAGSAEGEEGETFDPNSGPWMRPVDRGRSRIRATSPRLRPPRSRRSNHPRGIAYATSLPRVVCRGSYRV